MVVLHFLTFDSINARNGYFSQEDRYWFFRLKQFCNSAIIPFRYFVNFISIPDSPQYYRIMPDLVKNAALYWLDHTNNINVLTFQIFLCVVPQKVVQ